MVMTFRWVRKKVGLRFDIKIPAGDLVVLIASILKGFQGLWNKYLLNAPEKWMNYPALKRPKMCRDLNLSGTLVQIEKNLVLWIPAGVLLLLLTSVLFVLLFFAG